MWKLTLQDINTTPKELKTERYCSHRQLFRTLWGLSVWRNNQRKPWWEISAHSDLSPNLELSTPTESRNATCLLGGKSPSVNTTNGEWIFNVLSLNRPFARWRYFTTTTRILFVFPFIFKFGNPSEVQMAKALIWTRKQNPERFWS